MLRSFPENPQFCPNILYQQTLINHKMEGCCVSQLLTVNSDLVVPVLDIDLDLA